MAVYLDLATFLLIAEEVLETPAEDLARLPGLHLAESALNAPAAEFGGVEFYPDLVLKAAVLCARIAKNHPLPDGNKRTAFLSMLEFLDANGTAWHRTAADPEETVAMIEGVASGTVDEHALADWIRERVG
jgi:death on curing protein